MCIIIIYSITILPSTDRLKFPHREFHSIQKRLQTNVSFGIFAADFIIQKKTTKAELNLPISEYIITIDALGITKLMNILRG